MCTTLVRGVLLFGRGGVMLASNGVMAADVSSANRETLWRIGRSDDSAAEFCHGPDEYAAYDRDGCFIVGRSRAAEATMVPGEKVASGRNVVAADGTGAQ